MFSASNGTAASPSALSSGKRVGQLGFLVHDGNGFGGSEAISSATITVESAEAATTSNARGVNMVIDFLPTGGAATDGDATSDRKVVLTMDHDTFDVGTSSNNVTQAYYGEATFKNNLQVDGSEIDFTNLPTSDPSVAGRLYNDSGTVKISAG